MKPLCQTCINIFHFPECCTENLTDCVKLVTNCANYSRHDMGERGVITSEQNNPMRQQAETKTP